MFSSFRHLLRPKAARPQPAMPAGARVYAVGDIHGHDDLFASVQQAIEDDDAGREPAETTIILLGDLIDRGPDSAGVLARARTWQQCRRVRILTGNHEEMFLESFDKLDTLKSLLRFGGRETLLSYGIDPDTYTRATLEEVDTLMKTAVPQADLAFIASFEDHVAMGDYLFVHAGIRPNVALDEQTPDDLRWIREPFLAFRGDHGHVVVHGHTISDEPQVRSNRIGIDTGAYRSGTLTALGLEGTSRWLIEARAENGSIAVTQRNVA